MNNLEQQHQERMDAETEHWVDMNNALSELEKNPHFKKVVLEGYFTNMAVNQVSLLAADHTIREGKRTDIMESLIAISRLQDYFLTIKSLGTVMPEDPDSDME